MRATSLPTMRATRDLIENAVGDEIQANDPGQNLRAGDFQDVLDECVSKMLQVMGDEKRTELADNDRAFVAGRVAEMVISFFTQYEAERCKPTRFKRTERVVCRMGGDREWASGIVAAINEDDPEDPSGRTKFPYVVKLDAPAKLISVPADEYDVCRAEVCFGQRSEALWFTLFSLPSRRLAAKKRFSVGERVACAVEDESDDYSVWAAGTVLDVDFSVEQDAKALLPDREWEGNAAVVPYRVQLDNGCKVLVHRDEHWLLRDLKFQAAGPRQTRTTRCMDRFVKRHKGDFVFEEFGQFEAVDHMTRQVRKCSPPLDSDSEHEEDCECGKDAWKDQW